MNISMNRREFLRNSSGIVAGVAAASLWNGSSVSAEQVKVSTPNAEKLGWKMSVATYTYRRFPLYEALDKIAALGVRHIEPAFFLKLDKARPTLQINENLSAEVRKEFKSKLADMGISMSSFYSSLNADEDKAKKIFEFCKEMGAGTIVAEPPDNAFDMIEKLCEEYKINVAIHNHPEKQNYKNWKPENVLELCKNRSKRIGGCCDTGHWVRSGLDAVECLKKMEGRIVSFHLKDAAEMGNRKSPDSILGEGKANYKEVLKELKRQGYKGLTAIEYENDTSALQEEMVKNVAFVESVAKELVG
ncbi:MAG: sugar phosphate isomerase/epimerase [Kiritimatiellae bacterium]|nr:sugar phosphate isomerase/epimerase [Kiritimatiellia bacterium]MDD5519294.1 sugar phosphate isomerase/epimerase [Kiritimatiellia bacterium]